MKRIDIIRRMVKFRVRNYPSPFDINLDLIDKHPEVLLCGLPEALVYDIITGYKPKTTLEIPVYESDAINDDEADDADNFERTIFHNISQIKDIENYIVGKINAQYPIEIASHYDYNVVKAIIRVGFPNHFPLQIELPTMFRPKTELILRSSNFAEELLNTMIHRAVEQKIREQEIEQEDIAYENKWLRIGVIVLVLGVIAMFTGSGYSMNWFQIIMMVPCIWIGMMMPYLLFLKLIRYIKKQFKK